MLIRFLLILIFISCGLGCGPNHVADQNNENSVLYKSGSDLNSANAVRNGYGYRSWFAANNLYFPNWNQQSYANANMNHFIYFNPEIIKILREEATARINLAEAQRKKVEEETAQEKEKLELFLRTKSLILAKISKIEKELTSYRNQQNTIQFLERKVQNLAQGKTNDKESFSAFYFLLETLGGSSRAVLSEINIPDLQADQFVSTSSLITIGGKIEANKVIAFTGGSGLDYFEFLKTRRQNPISDKARNALIEILGVIDHVSSEWNKKAEIQMAELKKAAAIEEEKIRDLISTL